MQHVKFAFPDGLFMSFQLQYLRFNYTLLQCVCLGVKVFESLPDLFFVNKRIHVSSHGHSWWLFKVVSIHVKKKVYHGVMKLTQTIFKF